jgi:hypothetical protein
MTGINVPARALTSTHEHHREERRRIVDVTVLLGWYTGVSLTLAAYHDASPAVGLIHSQTINQQHNIDKEQRR